MITNACTLLFILIKLVEETFNFKPILQQIINKFKKKQRHPTHIYEENSYKFTQNQLK